MHCTLKHSRKSKQRLCHDAMEATETLQLLLCIHKELVNRSRHLFVLSRSFVLWNVSTRRRCFSCIFNDTNCTPWTSKSHKRIIMSLLHNISHEIHFTLSNRDALFILIPCMRMCRKQKRFVDRGRRRKRLIKIIYGSKMHLTLTWHRSSSSWRKHIFGGAC